jgi:hypothetical protein
MSGHFIAECRGKQIELIDNKRSILFIFGIKNGKAREYKPIHKFSMRVQPMASIIAFLLKTNINLKRKVLVNLGLYATTGHLKDIFSPTIQQDDEEIIVIKD